MESELNQFVVKNLGAMNDYKHTLLIPSKYKDDAYTIMGIEHRGNPINSLYSAKYGVKVEFNEDVNELSLTKTNYYGK
tara:strand:- start:8662 stop:8895 length:234 start_codon:yes stop_codon:yes gene_type:complete